MALTLNKIANNVASVTFQYSGDSVTIEYYPSKVTEKTFAQLQSFAQTNADNIIAGFSTLNGMLANLIKSWDVYQDDAETIMYPLTPDALAELPIAFRTKVMQEILGDIRPEAITA